ncbi:hypothetical protein CLOBY_27010 [Clostridium saccharobutylicum]|nr:hypothetical protein [Clostridium saccharobutylicum]AQS10556.1 hypothetical protein CLOBY_27010 [Clostridium saccharobutylicum]NSB90455.1 hypothetical protein [Clostridium saccharobutylicum]NYC31510.1 hypothetical protein [Clostridium saccharobutylicum]OOM18829.1 hypothetical protein CLSAB_02870 [Clostridium saccharobutylicum]
MIEYLINQIVTNNLNYQEVITKRPDLQEKIDTYIKDNNLSINKS